MRLECRSRSSGGARGDVLTAAGVARCRRWPRAFAAERKDHRFYEIVEATMRQGFDYRYFALRDAGGEVRAVVLRRFPNFGEAWARD
jgi:hypothetical protein